MGKPKVTELKWRDAPLAEVRTPKGKLKITLGLGSGLSRRAEDAPGIVWAIGDRGPNLKIRTAVERWGLEHLAPLKDREGAKVLPLPDFQPCLVELRVGKKRVHLERVVPLEGPDGPLSGRAPAGSAEASMEPIFDLDGRVLPSDPAGVDTEGVAAAPDGTFWVCEEYGPSLMQVGHSGAVLRRWTPSGHTLAGAEAVLPEAARRRRLNRGFEGLAISGDGRWIYAVFQSGFEGDVHDTTTIWRLDIRTGALAGAYEYPFDEPESFTADAHDGEVEGKDLKVCDLSWVAHDRLLVLERISKSARIYAVNVAATGRLAKTLVFSTDDHPDVAPDLEGIALLTDRELLLATDNDFGTEGAETRFYRVTFDAAL